MPPPSPISVDLMLSKLRFLFFLAYVELPFTEIINRDPLTPNRVAVLLCYSVEESISLKLTC